MKKDNAWEKEKFCMTLLRHVSDASVTNTALLTFFFLGAFIKRDIFKPSDSGYKYREKQGSKLQL